jgi:hypothetical protein
MNNLIRDNEVNYLSCGLRNDLIKSITIIGGMVIGIANIYSNYLSIKDEHFKNEDKENVVKLREEKEYLLKQLNDAKNNYTQKEIELCNKYSSMTLAAEDNFKKIHNNLVETNNLHNKFSKELENLESGKLNQIEKERTLATIESLKTQMKNKNVEFELLNIKV